MADLETFNRPNTLKLGSVRMAHRPDADYAPAILYVDHIVAALDSGDDTTIVIMADNTEFEVNMTLDKFALRQRIDKANS